MQARELLSVLPADLIKSILARRQKMADQLPKELELRKEENDRAYKLAKEAKESLLALESEINNSKDHLGAIATARINFDEKEEFRRRSSSRLQNVKNKIEDCNEGIDFWKNMLEGDWGHLLEDAERVKSGGRSSFALANHRNGLSEEAEK